MSHVFVSYKRENEERVGRLVRALEEAGFAVWWDRGLVGGESWRAQIESALGAARCVVVAWTHESTGPAGDFVRDEAGDGKRRGILVPVLLDKTAPPLGFQELQAIDLRHWKGNRRDPFFEDLTAAVKAKMEGRAAPAAKGPSRRLWRRLAYGSWASGLAFLALGFGVDAFGLQRRVCGWPWLAGGCGAVGLGGQPSAEERAAWEAREPGSCEAIESHLRRFPNGAYRNEAASLVAAARVSQVEVWKPVTKPLELFEARGEAYSPNRASAEAAALARAQPAAERKCRGFAASTLFRFRSARAAAEERTCEGGGRGVVCEFQGQAVCELDQREVREVRTCGK